MCAVWSDAHPILKAKAMKLHVIGSSSAGNGYVLQTDDQRESLVLECGCQFSKYAAAIGHRISSIRGAIITHEHGDHAKYIAEFHANGIDTFCTRGTWKESVKKYGGNAARNYEIERLDWVKIGGFHVLAVASMHDAAEPCNFIVRHAEMADLVFITDTMDFPYTTAGATNIMIETNFDIETLESICPDAAHRMRLVSTHMSIQNAIAAVRRQETSKLRNIVMIHLSSRHGNEKKFKLMMMENFGSNVTVAKPGVIVDLNQSIQF